MKRADGAAAAGGEPRTTCRREHPTAAKNFRSERRIVRSLYLRAAHGTLDLESPHFSLESTAAGLHLLDNPLSWGCHCRRQLFANAAIAASRVGS